jgi:hypothetical protein
VAHLPFFCFDCCSCWSFVFQPESFVELILAQCSSDCFPLPDLVNSLSLFFIIPLDGSVVALCHTCSFPFFRTSRFSHCSDDLLFDFAFSLVSSRPVLLSVRLRSHCFRRVSCYLPGLVKCSTFLFVGGSSVEPFFLSFRLSRRSDILSRLHLTYEQVSRPNHHPFGFWQATDPLSRSLMVRETHPPVLTLNSIKFPKSPCGNTNRAP